MENCKAVKTSEEVDLIVKNVEITTCSKFSVYMKDKSYVSKGIFVKFQYMESVCACTCKMDIILE